MKTQVLTNLNPPPTLTEKEIITTSIKSGGSLQSNPAINMKTWTLSLTEAADLTCLMLKLDTDMIIVGLLEISSGRTQREKMAFCLGDSASFPVLSLVRRIKTTKSDLPTT